MSKVEDGFSPELEAEFGDWVTRNGVTTILFDLDGTLIDTPKLFTNTNQKFMQFCQKCLPDEDLNTLKEKVTELDRLSYELMGVSTHRQDYIVDNLCIHYGSELFREGLVIFDENYSTAPEMFDGVKQTLELCQRMELQLGLVTHADLVWTEFKLEAHGLSEYFDHVEAIDVETNKHKEAAHWKKVVDHFGEETSHVLVVGDNLNADIRPAQQIGVNHLAWIPSIWSQLEGGKPKGVYVVDKIGNLIATLTTQTPE